jgi:hypothetical protein
MPPHSVSLIWGCGEGEPEGRLRFLTLPEEHQALAMLEVMGEHDCGQAVTYGIWQ